MNDVETHNRYRHWIERSCDQVLYIKRATMVFNRPISVVSASPSGVHFASLHLASVWLKSLLVIVLMSTSFVQTSFSKDSSSPLFSNVVPSVWNSDSFHGARPVLDLDHFCGTDFNSPSSLAAFARYKADKAAGKYPIAAKGGVIPMVGDERPFNVSENNNWISLNFRLVEKTDLYYLWVEIAEINNGNVSVSVIANLRQVALNSSPARSIDPSKGFFANNQDVYGLPPNVDGDGFVDLLMYDIGRGSGTTLGYVSPQDLILNPTDGTGNGRDILYLDSNEGARSLTTLAAIAAHEYTHLIHQAYGSDETFLSEGYAEYAIDFNGYYWRPTTYVSSVSEVSLSLFNWRRDANGNQNVLDYERAALFVTYLGQRVGTAGVGEMLRGINKKGAAGIDSVLVLHDLNLANVIRDFHTANFFNDRSLDVRFGFEQPERSAHHASLTDAPIDGEVFFNDGEGEGGYIDAFFERINAGSVKYRRYNNVSDLFYNYDVPIDPIFGEATQVAARIRNSARIVLKRVGSPTLEFSEVFPSGSRRFIQGRFEWVMFIFVHNNPRNAAGDLAKLEAEWIPLSLATAVEDEAALPESWTLGVNYPNPFNPQTTIPITLQSSGQITLEIFDVLGRSQVVLAHGLTSAGNHSYTLDASGWNSGTYLVRLTTEKGIQTRLLTLLK